MMKILPIVGLVVLLISYNAYSAKWPRTNSVIKKDPKIEAQVKSILSSMSIEEKVGQIIQAEIKHVKPSDLKEYPLGSILNGGGSFPYNNKQAKISDWVRLADSYYNASTAAGKGIPLIWGTDAVHGHNNVVGATIFPHNIGLGAANNPALIEEIAKATALEVLATGIDWIFAPTVAVVRNDRWGRAYEGYSEDPAIVKKYATSMINGLQGKGENILNEDHLIATAKHFIGDGGTKDGVDQGDNQASEAELIRIHAQGYVSALNAGAQTVMASFNSWNGIKIHGYKYLLTDVLKKQMGFDGFVVGDWNGHGQVPGCSNESCPQAFNAGVDMFMVPTDWKPLFWNTVGQVKSGEISMERLNDAVTRILRVKIRYGLFDLGAPSTRKHAGYAKLVGSKKHREIARQAVRESLVLLKNKNNILPLAADSKVLVAGNGANNIGKQSGGWSVTWQGTGNTNADFPGGTSIFDGIKKVLSENGGEATLSVDGNFASKPDVAIVVFGEDPYAEGQGDIQNLHYAARFSEDINLLKRLKSQGIPVVSVFITGRPLWINPELNQSDAFLVAWLPGTEGVGVSDVLFKKADGSINYDFKGKLSFSWPANATQVEINKGDSKEKPLFNYGHGLTYSDTDSLGDNLSENPFPNGGGPGSKNEIDVLAGRPIVPFYSYSGDSDNNFKLMPNGVGSSQNNVVTAVTVDKDVQEDARRVEFKGYDTGSYYFQSANTINVSRYLKTEGVLTFDVRKDREVNNELNLIVNDTVLNFNSKFARLKIGEWKKITIPLKCFSDLGLNLQSLRKPFGIFTKGSVTLSLANIKLKSSGGQNLGCY